MIVRVTHTYINCSNCFLEICTCTCASWCHTSANYISECNTIIVINQYATQLLQYLQTIYQNATQLLQYLQTIYQNATQLLQYLQTIYQTATQVLQYLQTIYQNATQLLQ